MFFPHYRKVETEGDWRRLRKYELMKSHECTICRQASERPVRKHTPAGPAQPHRTLCSDPVYEQLDPDEEDGPPLVN